MAATKPAPSAILPTGTSNAAGATTTGTVVSIASAYSATIACKITNGATAPSSAPFLNFYGSGSDNNWTRFYQIGGDLTPSSLNPNAIAVPPDFTQVRVDCTGNTGQAVTCEAYLHQTTGI